MNPYTNDIPSSMSATESTPIRKNLSAASDEYRSRLRSPTITNAGTDTVSSATNSSSRSRADGISSMPMNAVTSRK